MVPAVGVVSLAWALSCLLSISESRTDKMECCKCVDLFPTNTISDPQILPSPFKIEVIEDSYSKGSEIHVNLVATGGRMFTSFMLGAYHYPKFHAGLAKEPLGRLTSLDDNNVVEKCRRSEGSTRAESYALQSTDAFQPAQKLRFTWSPNIEGKHVEFRATFIENDKTYWVSEKSRVLQHPLGKPVISKRTIPIINTEECGLRKGCYRDPPDCQEHECFYIFTWRELTGARMEFELGGLVDNQADRYVAVGLSDDKYMGDDTVFTCAHNSLDGSTGVYASYNEIDPKRNTPIVPREEGPKYSFLESEEGIHEYSRLRCRFTVDKDLDNQQLIPLGGDPQHLLFAHGFARRGVPKKPWLRTEEKPGASANRVSLTEFGDHTGWATYPLAKAHGIMMLLAWVLCASIGLLLTKYYKPMWPNQDYFGHKYWFVGHFNLMAMAFIFTVIGIILIFVETDGWSEADELPQKAHPILGIIIFICIIINPILALLRPAPDSRCRPVFNWFHWAFGTIANVLAIPTIFIGMDFGKVMVPWWATWILVFWVIFHIVVELTLEIHQCCTHKKNKERRKKHEAMKREYPKQHHLEPEPVGRRFKRFMLSLHIAITILITLIMVIIIAVASD